DNVENALRGQCLLPADEADPPCWLDGREGPDPENVVAFANGLLDVETLDLHGHTPLWFSPSCLPHAYDPEARCPLWLKFLDEVSASDPAWAEALGEWFGYCLTGDIRQHKMALLAGVARGGKSVVAAVLREVVGSDDCAAMDFAQLGSSFGLETLVGK